jgi:CheY-like chemotaxis protein
MTGTQTLIVVLVVVVGVFLLLLRALSLRTPGKAKLSFGEIFTAEIELGTADLDKAKATVRTAIEQRGAGDVRNADAQIDQVRTMRIARVLWVDDNPDYNLLETIALEELGLFVTKATSTEAGEFYLRRLEFALVITDLSRGADRDAGLELLKKVEHAQRDIPVIVYTLRAEEKRTWLTDAGARAVVDTPSDLIAAVQAHRPK